jgi:hypothetical protein
VPEDPAVPDAAGAAAHLGDRPAAFFSALLNEQFVLESARGVTVSESSSRAALYLTTLSSALVAFGFLARTPYAMPFLGLILPVVFLLGLVTYERLVQTSLEDVAALAAMQRIRSFHATLLPGAEQYFPQPVGRNAPNEMLDLGRPGSWRGVFFTLSTAIAVVNSVVAGAGLVVLVHSAGAGDPTAIGGGIGGTIAILVLHGLYQEGRYSWMARPVAPRSGEERDDPPALQVMRSRGGSARWFRRRPR